MRDSVDSQSDMSAPRYIDAHVHLWSSDIRKYPLSPGFSPERMQPQSFTAEELFRWARQVGVGRIVLIQMDFYGFDNSFMLDTMQVRPGVFSGVAQVDTRGRDPAGEMRRLKELGVRGVRITPQRRGESLWLRHATMEAMWRCGAEEQMAICALINPEDLPSLDQMCGRFYDTPVVVDHCARIGGDGKIRESDLEQLCNLARHPRTYVKLSAFYYLGRKQWPYTDLAPLIRRLIGAFGPERLMWGSDSPFQIQPPHTYENSLKLIRDCLDFLRDIDRVWILRGTADKVFFSG